MNTTKVVLKVVVLGQHDVIVRHHMPNDTYTVTYGAEHKRFPSLMQALAEYESCVVHAVTCAGFE